MKFTPDSTKLVTGARKDHRLLVWDIRYYRRPLNILSRAVDTNQRVYFDISPCGKYLVTGGSNGVVKVWDVDKVDWKNTLDTLDVDSDSATYKVRASRLPTRRQRDTQIKTVFRVSLCCLSVYQDPLYRGRLELSS